MRCERGEKNLQVSTLERVCESLDVPMWDVIGRQSGRSSGLAAASMPSGRDVLMTWSARMPDVTVTIRV